MIEFLLCIVACAAIAVLAANIQRLTSQLTLKLQAIKVKRKDNFRKKYLHTVAHTETCS